MNVQISAWHESQACLWCEKSRECVTAEFGEGFISQGNLCWGCLQKAVKVRSQQQTGSSCKPSCAPAESKPPAA